MTVKEIILQEQEMIKSEIKEFGLRILSISTVYPDDIFKEIETDIKEELKDRCIEI